MSTVSKIPPEKSGVKVRTDRALKPFANTMEEFFDNFFDRFPTRWADPIRDPFRDALPLMRNFDALREVEFPPIDMIDRENDLFVRCELPGVRKRDLEVSVVGDRLNIEGKRKFKEEEKDETYFRSEMGYGVIARSLVLPVSVDEKNIKAELKDGILEVTLPKVEVHKKHVIKVA